MLVLHVTANLSTRLILRQSLFTSAVPKMNRNLGVSCALPRRKGPEVKLGTRRCGSVRLCGVALTNKVALLDRRGKRLKREPAHLPS